MKNNLYLLIGLSLLIGCSSNPRNKQVSTNQSIEKKDSLGDKKLPQDVMTVKTDSSQIETPLYFDDPLRNLNDFTVKVDYAPLDNAINALASNKNTKVTFKKEYCYGDACCTYKVISDSTTKSVLYLFKGNCYEYGFNNGQFLIVNDTLSMVRNFSCSIYDFRTENSSPTIRMEEQLYLFNPENAVIKERTKVLRGDQNYTLKDIAFKDSIVDKAKLLAMQTEELHRILIFADTVKNENEN